jgi:hypothetical protein
MSAATAAAAAPLASAEAAAGFKLCGVPQCGHLAAVNTAGFH